MLQRTECADSYTMGRLRCQQISCTRVDEAVKREKRLSEGADAKTQRRSSRRCLNNAVLSSTKEGGDKVTWRHIIDHYVVKRPSLSALGANNTISQLRFTYLTGLLVFRLSFYASMPYRYCRKGTGGRRDLNINTWLYV
jgi:hypothetical protein